MIKRFFGVVLFLVSFASWSAAPGSVSFSLYGVELSDLVRVVVDDVAGASLVVSPGVHGDSSKVDFVLKSSSKEAALLALTDLVKGRGLSLVNRSGVFWLEKESVPESDVLVYLPKYRSASYLTDLIGGIIPRSNIVNNRQIAQAVPLNSAPGHAQVSAPIGSGLETGTNVNSLIDKSEKDAIVIKAKPGELEQVKKMLAQVDRPVPEMLVKAVIMEVQAGNVEGSAINLLASLVAKGASVGASWKGGADSENAITFKVGGIEAVWSAISSDSRFKVVSAPQVRVRSGASARFSVGADTPVLGAVNYQGNGQSVQSVEYKPSGVILELKPEIRGALAELRVMQQLSSFSKTETGVNNSPTLYKRELSTSVVVGQNDVVLLGGLDEEKTSGKNAGFFFMPKFLRSDSTEAAKTEIVLMLYVQRVSTPGEAI